MPDQEMRAALGAALNKLMDEDERILLVNADLAGALGTSAVIKAHPDRCYDVGIQEANMTSFAAGLASSGYIPFIASFTSFTSRRACDQLMVSVAFAQQPVKVIGGDPGVSAQINGGTHMCFEDVAIMRSMAGFKVVEPADPHSMSVLLPQIAADPSPVYIRSFRKKRANVYPENPDLKLGRAEIVRDGTDVSLIASGVELLEAMKAAETLSEEGISAEVVDVHTVKPLDAETVLDSVSRTGAGVTCDNASVFGGLGDAVSEVVSESHPVPLTRIGVHDRVGQVGPLDFLLDEYQLSAPWIVKAARKAIAAK